MQELNRSKIGSRIALAAERAGCAARLAEARHRQLRRRTVSVEGPVRSGGRRAPWLGAAPPARFQLRARPL